MIRRAILLVSCVAAPAAFAAGLWRGENRPPEPSVVAARVNAPLVARPGSGVSEAGRYFAALNAPPPPPPPPPLPEPPPPPPPPDVALLFRRDLSAVLASPGAEPRVVLRGARSLRPGEIYQDGWTLASVSNTTAVLTKGSEQRSIGLFSAPPVQQPSGADASAPGLGAQVAFANASPSGRPTSSQVAGVVAALRSTGMTAQQTDRIAGMMSAGTFDQGAAQQMLSQMTRSNPMTPQQIAVVVGSLQRAGMLTPRQAQALSQSLPQMQSAQQVQQVMQMGERGNRRGGRNLAPSAPNSGFSGGNSTTLAPGRVRSFPPPPSGPPQALPPGRVGAFPAAPRVMPSPVPPPSPLSLGPGVGTGDINQRMPDLGRTLLSMNSAPDGAPNAGVGGIMQ